MKNYVNMIAEVEVIVEVEDGQTPDKIQVAEEIKRAIKEGGWIHMCSVKEVARRTE